MKRHTRVPALALVLLLGACSSTPITRNTLEQAQDDYRRSSADPNVVRLAPNELAQAEKAIKDAKEAWDAHADDEQVEGLAHIAKQKVAIADETAKRRQAEAQYATTARERDQLVAAQRTAEAARANQAAMAAREHAQRLEEQLRELAAKSSERGAIISLDNLVFATGSAQVNPGGVLKLRKLADLLVQNPERSVMVEGFTDSVGDEAYNRELSERRAEAIRTTLVGMGVNADRISTRGYGESFPVAANDTAAGRQLNRRVEIVIANDTGQITPRVASTAR